MFLAYAGLTEPDNAAQLWRYMPAWQLLDLLETKELYFRRQDKFDKPLHGLDAQGDNSDISAPPPGQRAARHGSADTQINRIVGKSIKNRVFVSCWTEAASENLRLWEEFTGKDDPDGVALVTNTLAIKQGIDDARVFHVGAVKYTDDNYVAANNDPVLDACLKRRTYAAEHEVRLLHHDGGFATTHRNPLSGHSAIKPSNDIGQRFKLQLARVVQRVVVSPFAPAAKINITRKMLRAAGLNDVSCERSRIALRA